MEVRSLLTPMNIAIGIAVFIIIILFVVWNKKNKEQQEGYSSSAMTHIGGLSDYEKISPFPPESSMKEYGSQYNPFYPVGMNKLEGFSQEEQPLPVHSGWNEERTLNRLDRIDSDLLPKTSTNVTPYNIDVADPTAYSFQVHAPRVIRKDRLAMLADPLRGDPPIKIYPDIPMVQRSQFNRDSLRLDGTFSEALAKSYDRMTGKSYFNKPSMLSHGGMMM